MAKGLPYFKFISTEWLTGDICFESFETQGLFINICALYWQRDGKISIEDIEKRYKKPTALESLLGRFILVNDGFISIQFLDEQFEERNHISERNSANGSKGGRPKTLEKKPTANPPQSDSKPIRRRIRKEEECIPELTEFLDYVKTLEIYKPELEYSVKSKYETWKADNWIDGNGKSIKNWKTKISNTMPFLKPVQQMSNSTKETKYL